MYIKQAVTHTLVDATVMIVAIFVSAYVIIQYNSIVSV